METRLENILVDYRGGVAVLTLNREKQLNALNRSVFADLEVAFTELAGRAEVKGIILTGSGQKAFAAGADIKEFMNFDAAQARALAANGQRILKLIELCPKPVIAAVNGFALGGGCELAMACHLRVASENAVFGQPEVSLGVTPGYAGTQRLVQLVGKSKGMEMLMTGDMVKAEQAERLGLVNYVVPQERLLEASLELMGKITRRSPVAVAGVIRCVDAFYQDGVDGFATEVEIFGQCFESQDFREGTQAFVEKRQPAFPGK